ncbi:ROK family transcriptional regulator [Nocardia mexicana]|uniref:Putative NBD/HSP70 family sugar kinase n=1 Tax=Nocardia mexicana TaxID=279262 RepID=A0A370HEI9_9NOCA|nr:ROK family transcriptional regulator [Nocardia mexicana]RDI53303.1 putative NBD/HSP70 family sugar kinase [Nocardia mexicana]
MDDHSAPSDSVAVRRRNLGLVLRHIAAHGPCARTEIAAATSLSHATVTTLITDLTARGLVREDGVRHGDGRGRPRRLIRLVPGRALVVAVQISLDLLRVAVADLSGAIVWREATEHHSTPGEPAEMATAVAASIGRAAVATGSAGTALTTGMAGATETAGTAGTAGTTDSVDTAGATGTAGTTGAAAKLVRTAVAMAGPVGADGEQTVLAATDFGWFRPVRLGALIAERLPDSDCPLDVINDANAAALAEYYAHPGRPRAMVYIEAGTGIGGGVVLDGRVHTGSHGIAGEPGHIPVALDGPACTCGARGCLVCYAGPEAVVTAAGFGATLRQDGLRNALARLDTALRQGDERAEAALRQAGRAVGTAVLSISGLLDAEEIVLGGLLAHWLPWLEPAVSQVTAGRRALVPTVRTAVTAARLGEDAILSGALELARQAVLDDPAAIPPLPTHPLRVPAPPTGR